MVEESENYAQIMSNKRSYDDDDSSEKDTKRQNTGGRPLLKLLIPNYAAGALIGRGGELLHEVQNKYGGSVRLSSNRECYPGTNERIVVIMGEVNEIININKHIMERVQDPGPQSENVPRNEQRAQKVKIVLTSPAAGLLIGAKGATIQAIQEECNANISIGKKESTSDLEERVLLLSGSMDQRVEACKHIIEKIANEPSNMSNTKLRYSSGDGSYGGNYGYSNMMGKNNIASLSNTSRKPKLKIKAVATLEVPDIMVGAMLGKNGAVIRSLGVRSGAIFKFSEKNEFAAGTNNRTLTITGNMSQTATAYNLINERMDELGSQFDTELGGQSNTQSEDEFKTRDQFNTQLGGQYNTQFNNALGSRFNDTPRTLFNNPPGSQFTNKPVSPFNNTPGSRYNSTPESQYNSISGSQFNNTSGDQFNNTPGSQFNKTPGSHLNNTPGNQLSNTPGNQLSNTHGNQLNTNQFRTY